MSNTTPSLTHADIAALTTGFVMSSTTIAPSAAPTNNFETPFNPPSGFLPIEPTTWDETRLAFSDVSGLVLKFLLTSGASTGRRIAEQIKLPFSLVQDLLRSLKMQLLVVYKGTSVVGDYEYELTATGLDRARRAYEHCSYCGSAPVSLEDYFDGVAKQSLRHQRPRMESLRRVFGDLLITEELLSRLGQAINFGRGLFLYGPPGNGKSSIAERIVRAAGETIWIPRALSIAGDFIRLFDPVTHQEVPIQPNDKWLSNSKIDNRWVRIRRPTVVVGGELTMAQFEVGFMPGRGIHEAPLQLKSNCGALVIDDFGRQRAGNMELLNRFIVPLEKGHDYMTLPSGRQVQIPFDQMLVLATNLEPRELVDEAFMRRLAYKIEVVNPTDREFREVLRTEAKLIGIAITDDVIDYLIDSYRRANRTFRFCHPRDLLLQAENYCAFHDRPRELKREVVDVVLKNYFTGL